MKLKSNGILSKRTYFFGMSHFQPPPLQLTIHNNFKTIAREAMYAQECWQVLSPTRKETSYCDRRFWVSYILFINIIGEILVLFIHITRL